jgi:hypothetical protein
MVSATSTLAISNEVASFTSPQGGVPMSVDDTTVDENAEARSTVLPLLGGEGRGTPIKLRFLPLAYGKKAYLLFIGE